MLGLRRLLGALLLVLLASPAVATADVTAEAMGPDVWLYSSGRSPGALDLTLTGDGAAVTIVSNTSERFVPTSYAPERACPAREPGSDTAVTCVSREPGLHPELLGVSFIGSGGNDRLDASALRGVAFIGSANDGADVVTGGPGDDGLSGDAGFDELHGGPGNDYLYLDDVQFHVGQVAPDSADSDCGPGDRDVVRRDLDDPPLSELAGCELEIPTFQAAPTVAGVGVAGAPLAVNEPGATGTENPATYRWRTCDAAGCGGVVGTGPTYVPTAADVGRVASVDVSRSVTGGPENRTYNAAATAQSAPIAAPAAAPTPPTTAPADTTAPTVVVRSKRLKADRKGRLTLRFGKASESGTGTLRVRGAGTKKLRLVAGRAGKARLKLGKAARRTLRKRGRVRLRATLTVRDAAGNTRRSHFTVTVRAQRHRRGR